jgi:uncharacterized protein HemY
MESTPTFRGGRISNSVAITFTVAVLAAFLLGGAGGYVVRAVTISTPQRATSTSVTHTVPQQTILPNRT